MKWTHKDSEAASKEGWDIFESSGDVTEDRLERIDDPADGSDPVFASDADAWRHVCARARAGSALHQKALDYLREQSHAEYARIREI